MNKSANAAKIPLAFSPFILIMAVLFSVILTNPVYRKDTFRRVSFDGGSVNLVVGRDRVCELKGRWLFWKDTFALDTRYAERASLARFPGSWKGIDGAKAFGYASYGLHVTGLDPEARYALRVGQTVSACSIIVNGVEVRSIGTVGVTRAGEKPGWNSVLAPFSPLSDGSADIVIQISNFHDYYCGSNASIYLGPEPLMLLTEDREGMLEGFTFAVLSVMSVFFFALFIIRRKDRPFLWFALLALTVGIRATCYDGFLVLDLFPSLGWPALFRVGYLTFPAAMVFFAAFLHSLYPAIARRGAVIGVVAAYSAYAAMILVAPEYVTAGFLFPYQLLGLATVVWGLVVIIVARVRGQQGSIWLLVGFAFAVVSFTYDVLVSMWLISGYSVVQLGMCAWLFCLALLVIERYTESFHRARLLSDQLTLINASLRRFVPAEFLAFLKKSSIVDIQPGDSAEVDMAILSADIRSFTTLAERMRPDDVFVFLNEYLEFVGPIIRSNGGFIAKYEGDGFFALFPTGPESAVRAAVQMQTAIASRNRRNPDKTPIAVGIGIDCGTLTLGTIGDESRLDGTVISQCVKCAGTFESATKQFHSRILINEAVYAGLPNPLAYFLRPVDRLMNDGRPSFIFEVYANDSDELREIKWRTQSDLEHALYAWFLGQYAEAKVFLSRVLSLFPDDPVAAHYARRLEVKD